MPPDILQGANCHKENLNLKNLIRPVTFYENLQVAFAIHIHAFKLVDVMLVYIY